METNQDAPPRPNAPSGPPSESSRWLGALAYFIAGVTGLFLLIVRRDDDFIRFHALQSVLATLAFFLGGLLLRILGNLPIIGWLYDFLYVVYSLLLFFYWLFLMFRAFQGDRYRIPYLGRIVERQIAD